MRFPLLLAACLTTAILPGRSLVAQEPAAPTLPDPAKLMLEVEQNQKAAEAATRDYTYKVHVDNLDYTKSGAVKKSTSTDSDSFTVDGVRVDKLFARNGKPLTDDEKRKEDERIDKQINKAKEQRAKRLAQGKPTDARGDELLTVSRILELGSFTNLHPDTFSGRPVWVMDYHGNPDAKTRTAFESVFKDLTGTVWIDQADHVLVAAHGIFDKDFKIGGGLLMNLHKGTTFDFRSVKVDNAVWLPDTIDARGSLRYLLFVSFNGGLHLKASEYKKFRSSARILPLGESDDQPAPQVPPAPK
ncbi:MAG: hypothetical protein PW792_12215 [Acidobacteriaceae bacterium]|nr:hypothetical protein [Acidobacteriaceae bacterium]